MAPVSLRRLRLPAECISSVKRTQAGRGEREGEEGEEGEAGEAAEVGGSARGWNGCSLGLQPPG